ncbi:MAG: glycosyltransferase family 39 protein [Myxococcota bacterium]|nr:glycosyltransferase family 39 protein [Myxococcota bacterium]
MVSSLLGFALALAVLVVFYMVRKPEERGWLMWIAVGAFLLKALLVPAYFQWLVYLGEGGFAYVDARGHHEQGVTIAEEIVYDTPSTSWGHKANDPGMYLVTAYTYILFGPNTLVIRFFLIMFVSAAMLYVYRITRMYFDEPTARLASAIYVFLPAPILLSLNHRKDPLVQLIVLFMFYHAIRVFRQEPGWRMSAALGVLGLIAVYPFRSGLILPFLGVLVICFVLANRSFVQGFLLAAGTVVVLIAVQVAIPEDARVNIDIYTQRTEAMLEGSAELSEVGGGLTRILRVTGPLDVYKIPFAAVAYLIMPFPPEISRAPVTTLGTFLHLISLALLPHMLLGAWSLIRGPDWRLKLPLLVFPLVFLVVLGTVSIGVPRYREIFYPICLVWAAIGWRIGTQLFLKLAVYGGLSALAIAVYLNRFGLI